MKIFTQNDIWGSLQKSIGLTQEKKTANLDSIFVTSVEKKSFLGPDAGIPMSNAVRYDASVKKDVLKKIDQIEKDSEKNFDKSEFGKKLKEIGSAIETLKRKSGKAFPSRDEEDDDIDLDDALTEAEAEAEAEALEEAETESPETPTQSVFDAPQSIKDLEEKYRDFWGVIKRFYTKNFFERIKKAIENEETFQGKTIEDLYIDLMLTPESRSNPEEVADKMKIYELWFDIAESIVDDNRVKKHFKDVPAMKTLEKYFSIPEGEGEKDQIEKSFSSDVYARQIFNYLSEVMGKKFPFTGRLGKFKITEEPGGNFNINGETVDGEDLQQAAKRLVSNAERAGLSKGTVEYLKGVVPGNSMADILEKYMMKTFLEKIESGDLKKKNADAVAAEIENEFAGTKFPKAFKAMAHNLGMFAPSAGKHEGKRFRADNDGYIEVKTSANGRFFGTIYYKGQKIGPYELDSFPEFADEIEAGFTTDVVGATSTFYKLILEREIEKEFLKGSIRNSKFKESRFFNEIREKLERTTGSSVNYSKLISIKAAMQSRGIPRDPNNPLLGFSVSFSYGNSSFFIDFAQTSPNSFKITNVHWNEDGDKQTAAKVRNALVGQIGEYNFNADDYRDLADSKEEDRVRIADEISRFYSDFISRTLNKVPQEKVKPVKIGPAPKSEPVQEKEEISNEQILSYFQEHQKLSQKKKLSAEEQKKMEQIEDLLGDEADRLVKLVSTEDEADALQFFEEAERGIDVLPVKEQRRLMERFHKLKALVRSPKVNNKDKAKYEEELEKLSDLLVEKANFANNETPGEDAADIERTLLDLDMFDEKTPDASSRMALKLLENSSHRREYLQTARKNLDKYPEIKKFLQSVGTHGNDNYKKFVELVYAD